MIGRVLGNYRITVQIGAGGMGIVYAAEHILLGKKAAIKVLKPERCTNPEIIERFFNEARAASMVKDPGIPEIFDYGRLPAGNAYLVMEMLEGQTLGQVLEDSIKLSPGRAVSLSRLIAGTLGTTHEHGIIHRDLKPDNIFLVPDAAMPRGERIKILDFGIAKLQRNAFETKVQTEVGRLMGTPYYMSPEQCRGAGNVDHRTDIYSLGCVLYQMLTGRPPFAMKGSGEVLGAHIHLVPKAVSLLEPAIPTVLSDLVADILAKNPKDRPQSMADVIRRLNAIPFVSMPMSEPSLAASIEMPTGFERQATTTLQSTSGEHVSRDTQGGHPTWYDEALRRRRRTIAWVAMGCISCIVIAGGLWSRLGQQHEVQVTRERSRQQSSQQTEPKAAVVVRELEEHVSTMRPRQLPEEITLLIESVPSDARVYRAADGVQVGRTPYRITVPRGPYTASFLVRKFGYESRELAMSTLSDREELVALEKKPERKPEKKPEKKRKKATLAQRDGREVNEEPGREVVQASPQPTNSHVPVSAPITPARGRDDVIDPF